MYKHICMQKFLSFERLYIISKYGMFYTTTTLYFTPL